MGVCQLVIVLLSCFMLCENANSAPAAQYHQINWVTPPSTGWRTIYIGGSGDNSRANSYGQAEYEHAVTPRSYGYGTYTTRPDYRSVVESSYQTPEPRVRYWSTGGSGYGSEAQPSYQNRYQSRYQPSYGPASQPDPDPEPQPESNSGGVGFSLSVRGSDGRGGKLDMRFGGGDNLVTINLSYLGEKIYGKPSRKTGDKVAESSKNSSANPEELGDYVEGDILQGEFFTSDKSSLWPNNVVPYVISGAFNYHQKNLIEQAMADYHTHTCVRFIPRSNERNYVDITGDWSGCHSAVGRTGRGRQVVNLQTNGCFDAKGTIIHELGHVVGLGHEQSRSIRDDYVNIFWSNIMWGMTGNFDKRQTPVDATDFPYDYGSVMHYSSTAFGWPGSKTIEAKNNPRMELGQRRGFSDQDIKKINLLYSCNPSSGRSRGNGNGVTPSPPRVTNITNRNKVIQKCIFGIYCWYEQYVEETTDSPVIGTRKGQSYVWWL